MTEPATQKRELERKIAVIVDRYRQELPRRVAELRLKWAELAYAAQPQPVMERLFFIAHTMKGSSATLGFMDVSAEASRIDACLRPLLQSSRQPDEVECAHIEAALERLDALSSRSLPSATETAVANRAADAVLADSSAQRVLLLTCGTQRDPAFIDQLQQFGFDVFALSDARDLATQWRSHPGVVVVDTGVDTEGECAQAVQSLQQSSGKAVPVIFLSERSDIKTRLDAVRSGGCAFFLKPVTASKLVDVLDRLTEGERAEPYRVLIVEDSGLLGAFYAVALEGGGMRTRVIREPLQLLDAMAEFSPELVLMDMYLPDYTGAELAALIRQEASLVGIPIVYLSSESDRGKQLLAMSRGGDDFLTKPITPEHLLSAVRTRAERYRALSRLMVRDGLTGLLNHSRIKEQIAVEFRRAQRNGTRLAIAMLDIDHFKSVNDRFGHGVGDQVIQSLARLMRQRLRTTDVIGRYGGEEFAVLLENATREDAFRIMDDLRTRFSAIRQRAGDTEFQVTLSCGIASFPGYGDDAAMVGAADRALYAAKDAGRNQVRMDLD